MKKINKKYSVLILVVFLSILIAVVLIKNNLNQKVELKNWITYIDPKNRFSVLMPRKPNEDVKNEKYTSANGDTVYSIYVSSSLPDDEVKSILKNSGQSAKVIYASHFNDASGIPFLDFKIENSKVIKKGRMFFASEKSFVLLDEIIKKEDDANGFNAFLSSFTLNQ